MLLWYGGAPVQPRGSEVALVPACLAADLYLVRQQINSPGRICHPSARRIRVQNPADTGWKTSSSPRRERIGALRAPPTAQLPCAAFVLQPRLGSRCCATGGEVSDLGRRLRWLRWLRLRLHSRGPGELDNRRGEKYLADCNNSVMNKKFQSRKYLHLETQILIPCNAICSLSFQSPEIPVAPCLYFTAVGDAHN